MKRGRWLWMLVVLLLGCQGTPATPPASPTLPRATATATVALPSPTGTPSPTPSATLAPTSTPSPTPCAAEVCLLAWHFPLAQPIAPPDNSVIAPTYPFGSDYHGLRPVHHGVDMENPIGTPIHAAADGRVVFAGSDTTHLLGPFRNFYGQAVILEHHLPEIPWPLYTLYGHLHDVGVTVGQTVVAGEVIGTVGSRGVAVGPHLHFEVRLGENTYDAAQNPVLWLRPRSTNDGVLAMRLTDTAGQPLRLEGIVVQGLDEGLPTVYPLPYADPHLPGDPRLHENLAIGDLPAGRYQITLTCCGRLYRWNVAISPQHLTFIRKTLP